MSRLRRLYLSDRYFFITCCLARQHSLLGSHEFSLLAESIRKVRENQTFLLTAWIFLPDHWHAIIFPPSPLTISTVMETIKVISTQRINQLRRTTGPLWQPRFFDRVIRTVERYHHFVDYIHLNPVRRNLVQQPEDWPWSSIHDCMGQRPSPLPVDIVNLTLDPQAKP